MRKHDETWFAEKEAELRQPTENTIHYHTFHGELKVFFGVVLLPVGLVFGIILLVLGIRQLVRNEKYLKKFTECTNDCLSRGRTVTFDGAPGAGKTFSGSNIAYTLAKNNFSKMTEDYYLQSAMVTEWTRRGETDKLEEYRALKASWEFYAARANMYIPCLVTSIPLREYDTGRMSYVLDPMMFLQVERVPVYTVLFNDESGDLDGNDKSTTDNNDYKALWRFIRHFFDGMGVNTNQDAEQNSIIIRRSTDYSDHLFGQEWVMQPEGLIRKFNRKMCRYYRKLFSEKLTPEQQIYKAQELYYLKEYINTIGFRVVTHQLRTTEGVAVSGIEEYIFPAIGVVEYDDRCWRKLYKCKDKDLDLKGWEKLTVESRNRDEYDELLKGDKRSGTVGTRNARGAAAR